MRWLTGIVLLALGGLTVYAMLGNPRVIDGAHDRAAILASVAVAAVMTVGMLLLFGGAAW